MTSVLPASSALSAASAASAALVLAAAGLAAQSAPNPFDVAGAGRIETRHLTVTPSIGTTRLTPGTRLSVALDIVPKRAMHVYAPGRHDYQVVTIVIESQPWLKVLPVTYPPSERHHFEALDETVEVYSKPFTLRQPIAVLDTPAARRSLAAASRATVAGHLAYQACDDAVCYARAKVPFSFTLDVSP